VNEANPHELAKALARSALSNISGRNHVTEISFIPPKVTELGFQIKTMQNGENQ